MIEAIVGLIFVAVGSLSLYVVLAVVLVYICTRLQLRRLERRAKPLLYCRPESSATVTQRLTKTVVLPRSARPDTTVLPRHAQSESPKQGEYPTRMQMRRASSTSHDGLEAVRGRRLHKSS